MFYERPCAIEHKAALHEVYFGSDPCALPLVATQPVGQESYDPPGDLIPGTTYYWWIDEVNDAGPPPGNWSGVLWSFTVRPYGTYDPFPFDGATFVPTNVTLTWKAGTILDGVVAGNYDVFFGTDEADVHDANYGDPEWLEDFPESTPSCNPSAEGYIVENDTEYFWRIASLDSYYATLDRGNVWRFTTGVPPPP